MLVGNALETIVPVGVGLLGLLVAYYVLAALVRGASSLRSGIRRGLEARGDHGLVENLIATAHAKAQARRDRAEIDRVEAAAARELLRRALAGDDPLTPEERATVRRALDE